MFTKNCFEKCPNEQISIPIFISGKKQKKVNQSSGSLSFADSYSLNHNSLSLGSFDFQLQGGTKQRNGWGRWTRVHGQHCPKTHQKKTSVSLSAMASFFAMSSTKSILALFSRFYFHHRFPILHPFPCRNKRKTGFSTGFLFFCWFRWWRTPSSLSSPLKLLPSLQFSTLRTWGIFWLLLGPWSSWLSKLPIWRRFVLLAIQLSSSCIICICCNFALVHNIIITIIGKYLIICNCIVHCLFLWKVKSGKASCSYAHKFRW